MTYLLLIAAIAFGLMAAFVHEQPVKKVSIILFVVCAVAFVLLALVPASGLLGRP